MKKKLWLVKREVIATSITAAMRGKGRIYEIQETRDEVPNEKSILVGFSKKKIK